MNNLFEIISAPNFRIDTNTSMSHGNLPRKLGVIIWKVPFIFAFPREMKSNSASSKFIAWIKCVGGERMSDIQMNETQLRSHSKDTENDLHLKQYVWLVRDVHITMRKEYKRSSSAIFYVNGVPVSCNANPQVSTFYVLM